jgi:phage shock protein A
MALITRLARLWRADINALLDRLEAPDLVLAQAIREMEQALDADRRRLAHHMRELDRLGPQEAACTETLGQAASALEDCLAEGREDLARPLIRRRLEGEREQRRLGQRRAELEAELERARRRIAERESQLADLRARAAAYQESATVPDEDPVGWTVSPIRDEDVEIHLLRAKRQRGGAE